MKRDNEVSEQAWSERIVVVKLPPEPQTYDELDRVIQVAVNEFDIVVDFAGVQTLSPSSLRRLVVVHRILDGSTRCLGFCNANPAIRSALTTHKIGQFIKTDWNREISLNPLVNQTRGGSVVLGNQDRDKTHERRSCVRFNICKSLRTPTLLWHRFSDIDHLEADSLNCLQCTLVDVSEGGAQVVIDTMPEPIFRKGQYVILQFSHLACETPFNFDALITWVLPTADSEHICLGLKFVELEVNTEGCLSLQRLCESAGRYFEVLP